MQTIRLMLRHRISLSRNFNTAQQQNVVQQQQASETHSGHDSGIRVYNCTAKRLVPLILKNKHYVSWYTCGPTVYDATHLGHASCYVKIDIIQRILRQHFNLNLVTAMNITDIDDKIIQKSLDTGRDWQEIAKSYEAEFWQDLQRLNVTEPNFKIRVTEYMPKIIAFIAEIIANNGAYVGTDNSVYFAVEKYANYGKLQKLNMDESKNEKLEGKRASFDFALWKAQKATNEPSWDSPWGAGRPGWHIECSALASHIFGQRIDFHAGGLDLRFPHHENEEAQSCVFHNTNQWVNYWLHTGQLNIKGQKEKMSKSLKNTISIEQMLAKYTADEFRMACLLSNYRNAMEYSDELMETARANLNKFRAFNQDCQAYLNGKKSGANLNAVVILKSLQDAKLQLDACFKDDFDTSRSVSVLLELISSLSAAINSQSSMDLISTRCLDVVAAVDNFVLVALRIYGFKFATQNVAAGAVAEIMGLDTNALLEDLVQTRQIVRERAVSMKSKELFQICDELRKCLAQRGIEIKDHNRGSSWSFNSKK